MTVGLAEPGEGPGGSVDRPVKLTVHDSGPGIPEIVRERLFEPVSRSCNDHAIPACPVTTADLITALIQGHLRRAVRRSSAHGSHDGATILAVG